MKIGRNTYALLFALLVVVPACSSSELTRAKAKSMIEPRIEFVDVSVHDGLRCVTESPWFEVRPSQETRSAGDSKVDVKLTDEGQKFFSRLSKDHEWINPVIKPIPMTLDITGITKLSQTLAEVHFAWRYEGTPPDEVIRFWHECNQQQANTGVWHGMPQGSGKVNFRLYDDGWRIED